ncbi:hypothetical protein VB715_08525 [Crocosphaera sp. UHCC 0190]|uniref:hypothetical protein n=1 Tax=Crocosphaera sp. UHCC 0190 TaxID=3110246 RepID=UPI002B212783|nr:hypothetical protein [Crocosphaera sp. UHCC 0190]MEA5509807.1 hypothetical protein [Crocosphaera sp. UHCC 0190]
MNAAIIRQLWSIVEESSDKTVMSLNDSDLVNQLLHKLQARQYLSAEDWYVMSAYLSSRTLLIREIAQSQ